jgi:hypothetical protein
VAAEVMGLVQILAVEEYVLVWVLAIIFQTLDVVWVR